MEGGCDGVGSFCREKEGHAAMGYACEKHDGVLVIKFVVWREDWAWW